MSAAPDSVQRFTIREGTPEDAWQVAARIGEFGGYADRYGREVY